MPDSPAATSSAVKRFGDVAHQLALGKGRGYAVGEYDAWASKEAKAFKAEAESAGLTPIKRKDFDAAKVSAAIMRGQIERTLTILGGGRLPTYQTEVVFTWQEQTSRGLIWCRGMADVWCEELGVILDPKFTKVLSDGAWENHAVKMGWDIQDVWYRRGIEAILPERAGRIRFINPLVYPAAPFVGRIREADEATTHSLRPMINDTIEHFAACLYGNFWPGYSDLIEPWSARGWTLAERMAKAADEDLE
jgi:hypothetical protein